MSGSTQKEASNAPKTGNIEKFVPVPEIDPSEFCGIYLPETTGYRVKISKQEPEKPGGEPYLVLEYIPLDGTYITHDCYMERLSVQFGEGGKYWARGVLQEVKYDPIPPHDKLPQPACEKPDLESPTHRVDFTYNEKFGPMKMNWWRERSDVMETLRRI